MGIIRKTREIPLSELETGTGPARLRRVDQDIDELAESIRVVGLLEPIVVYENDRGKFEIITGQRRFFGGTIYNPGHRKELNCASGFQGPRPNEHQTSGKEPTDFPHCGSEARSTSRGS